jgi:hypothetical protein
MAETQVKGEIVLDSKVEAQGIKTGIIGEVAIGRVNPRKLSKEEFSNSDELLFHGAARGFTYSPEGKYDVRSTTGSTDYGFGFYATDSWDQANNYSAVRNGENIKSPIVYSFLPHEAKMLDVRDVDDPGDNGVLPNDFVANWISYLGACIKDEVNWSTIYDDEVIGRIIREGARDKFLIPLDEAVSRGERITIRGSRKERGIFNADANGLIDWIFKGFMLAQGFDGMIYREGGEGENRQNLTGFVFYNPKVIDTWEGWQGRKDES